jgi:hypothetical protein
MYNYESLKYVVFDIEANGLEPDRVHCIVTKVIGQKEVKQFYGDTLFDAIEELTSADILVGHNILTYDLPVLENVLGWNLDRDRVVDTLVVSKVLSPDRKLPEGCPTSVKNPITGLLDKMTPHSLATWGYRVGRGKPPYYNWDEFDLEMLNRCTEDVEINDLVFHALIKEIAKWDWSASICLEHKIARVIHEQEVTGFPFDLSLANQHLITLEGIMSPLYDTIRGYLHKELIVGTVLSKPFKKNGEYSKNVINYWGSEVDRVGGPFTRIGYEEPSLTKRQKLVAQLLELGWKPREKTPGGDWKLTDKGKPVASLAEMELPVGKKLAEYYTYSHRKSQIEGFIRNLRPDGRLTAGADSAGTNTARMKHKIVVNVPKSDPKVLFGKQMRQLFIPEKNHWLVGWDASGLEARVMAHYTFKHDGGAFADLILRGDVHTHNAHIFYPEETEGMERADKEFTPFRNKSKNGFYALVYGALPPKLGETLGIPKKVAEKRHQDFWEHNPGLGKLRNIVLRMADEYGYVPGIDGRKIFIRSSHSALNALFQSCGSIVMKVGTGILVDKLGVERLQYEFHANVHDELQAGVPKRYVLSYSGTEEMCLARPYSGQIWTPPRLGSDGQWHTYYSRVGELAVESIRQAGEELSMRIPMDAEYAVGSNWSETH